MMTKGSQSIAFQEAPYIISSGSVVGKKEGEGPLGKLFDMVEMENLFGEDTWEAAESTMQKEACLLAVGKADIALEKVRYLFTASGNCYIHGSGGASDSDVRTLWSLFYIRRGNRIGSDERGSGIWRVYAGCDIKSFWKCRKRISFSAWVCKSKTVVSTLDSDREWGISNWKAEKSCEGSWCDSW